MFDLDAVLFPPPPPPTHTLSVLGFLIKQLFSKVTLLLPKLSLAHISEKEGKNGF